MSDVHVELDYESQAAMNQIVMRVVRDLDEQERQVLAQVWDAGYDSCRDERNRQERDPSYPLHRRNPFRKDDR